MGTSSTTREQWLSAFWSLAKPVFREALADPPGVEANLDTPIRISVGWPSKGRRSNTIGECWAPSASADGHAEIFIRPSLQSSAEDVAAVLTHELLHAVLPEGTGHGAPFSRSAKALGLVGPSTATKAGDGWREWAGPLLDELGAFPGAALHGGRPDGPTGPSKRREGNPGDEPTAPEGGAKKQTTRMLKLTCYSCGWSCRTTAKHIDGFLLACPVRGCGGALERA